MRDNLWEYIRLVREKAPLVHNISNYVVMNNTANALLAIGASPVMAHAHQEVKDMVSVAGSLVLNIGTLDEYWTESMRIAIRQAETLHKPWILDPVGAGVTPYRNRIAEELITSYHPVVIRGNASEIMSLAKMNAGIKGVESIHRPEEALEAAYQLHDATSAIICISGATDYISDGKKLISLQNGHPLMSLVTGMGCTATALTGAFCAAIPENSFDATVAAMALMGIAGEIAAKQSYGPGSFQVNFLDALFTISEDEFNERLKLESKNVSF